MSLEKHKAAEAETVTNVEGNMCGPAMRGSVAPPGSVGPITHGRNASEAGRSHVRPGGFGRAGPHWEGEEP